MQSTYESDGLHRDDPNWKNCRPGDSAMSKFSTRRKEWNALARPTPMRQG